MATVSSLQAHGFGALGDLHGAATVVNLRGQLGRYVAIAADNRSVILEFRVTDVDAKHHKLATRSAASWCRSPAPHALGQPLAAVSGPGR